MITSPSIIEETNVSIAWASALKKTLNNGGEVTPLIVTITDFNETTSVREVIDKNLADHKMPLIDTVSETIFPASLYEYTGYDREQLYAKYKKNLTRLKKIDSSNSNGTYFERLIAYNAKEQVNQLEIIIKSLNSTKNRRRSKLQAGIFDPMQDHTNKPFQGFPCLQHVTFYKSKQDGLILNSFYAIQFLYRRAYGNWLGLINLGKFVAREANLTFERFNCFIGVEHLDELKKVEAKKLLVELEKIGKKEGFSF